MLMMLAQADPAILEQFGANSDMIKKELERMNNLQELQVKMCDQNHVFYACTLITLFAERGSSALECQTRNRKSPGSNPLCYHFQDWAFSFSPLTPQLTQLYK